MHSEPLPPVQIKTGFVDNPKNPVQVERYMPENNLADESLTFDLSTSLKFAQTKASLVQREVPAGRRD